MCASLAFRKAYYGGTTVNLTFSLCNDKIVRVATLSQDLSSAIEKDLWKRLVEADMPSVLSFRISYAQQLAV